MTQKSPKLFPHLSGNAVPCDDIEGFAPVGDHRSPQFDLRDMIASTGRDMTDLAERMAYPGRALNRRERELAKTAITGHQMAILDELTMFVIGDSLSDVESSYDSLRSLMAMKAEL